MTTSATITTFVSKCPMCGKEGHKEIIERIPKNGVLIRFIHNDDKEQSTTTTTKHEWARYSSSNLERHKIRRNPKRMRCPECGKIGTINKYQPNDKKPWIYDYLIVHEAIRGKWGKGKNKVQRRNRCYIKVPEQRDLILKKLGLFVK
jgi:predicted RNA-binding Zn-ribbon protein involved in translation (DUF1610 family)